MDISYFVFHIIGIRTSTHFPCTNVEFVLQLPCPHVQFMWACCCGLDVIITFFNYDIKNLIVMQKAYSNKPTLMWTSVQGKYAHKMTIVFEVIEILH